MGTRAQVKIGKVYLYQHWDGDNLMKTVLKAAYSPEGQGRKNDEEYLARIIFQHMIKGATSPETGFGIGTEEHGDIDYLVTVDTEKQTITEGDINKNIQTVVKMTPAGLRNALVDMERKA